MAAAVGSLKMYTQSSPAILQASFVARLCLSLKYAGTVTTHFVTGFNNFSYALSLRVFRTYDEINSGCSNLSG